MDRLDEPTHLNWSNATEAHPVDQSGRSLTVATRVRIPLGLLSFAVTKDRLGGQECVDLSTQQLGKFTVLNRALEYMIRILLFTEVEWIASAA